MAGYSGTPLVKKLSIKEGSAIYVICAPSDYRTLLKPIPVGVRFEPAISDETNMVHLFETQRARLVTTLRALRKKLAADAIVWVSWPKKSSKTPTTITEDTIREVALPLGFVDVKVCAVTEISWLRCAFSLYGLGWPTLCMFLRRANPPIFGGSSC